MRTTSPKRKVSQPRRLNRSSGPRRLSKERLHELDGDIAATRFVHDLFASVDARLWSALPRYFHPEMVYERPGYEPLTGFPRILHFYLNERIIQCGSHEIRQILRGDEAIAVFGRFQGLSRDGEPLDERFADFYRMKDGKIFHRTTYFYRAAI